MTAKSKRKTYTLESTEKLRDCLQLNRERPNPNLLSNDVLVLLTGKDEFTALDFPLSDMIARNFQPQFQWLSGYAQFLQLSDEDFLDVDQLKTSDSSNLSTLQQQLQNLQNEGGANQRPPGENHFDPQQPDQTNDYYELTSLDQ